jgi:hypothetical protein
MHNPFRHWAELHCGSTPSGRTQSPVALHAEAPMSWLSSRAEMVKSALILHITLVLWTPRKPDQGRRTQMWFPSTVQTGMFPVRASNRRRQCACGWRCRCAFNACDASTLPCGSFRDSPGHPNEKHDCSGVWPYNFDRMA